jgi:outer membrane lipoprotein-sorting protein
MKFFIATILSLIFSISLAQDEKADKILASFANKVNTSSTFYMEFSVDSKSGGTNQTNLGKGWSKGEKYFATVGDFTRFSNGKKSWSVYKEEKSVYISDVDANEEDINPKKMIVSWDKDHKSKYEKEGKIGNETVHIVNVYPKMPKKYDYHTIVLYFSKDNNELRKAIVKGKDGSVVTYTFSNLQFNIDVPDSKFTFDKSKYPGYQVIED